jgi:DNA-binding ferritin-like protein
MEQLASLLLHSRTQTHAFHLGVKGVGALSAHLALGHYYDTIGGLVDGLVEAYQGQYGLIKIQPVSGLDTNNDIKNIIAYFDKLCAAVAKLRQDEKLQMSWLQNDIDTIVTLLYSTKYKLVNLQ